MLTLRRTPPVEQATHAGRRGRPVLLATIDAPFDEQAATFAVESALECGQPLIVANVLQIPLAPLCVAMGYGTLEPSEEVGANLPRRPSLRTPSASPSSGCGFSARIRSTPCSRSSKSVGRAFSSSPPTVRP